MKLQILVPQYNETEDVIKPLLDSLALQQQVDFKEDLGVIIANDGSDTFLSEDFLKGYPFDIKYLRCEHNGVSATRNACLDAATADYVMFIGEELEEWRDVKGYEGLYKISSYGRVLSVKRPKTLGGFMRYSIPKNGYKQTTFCKDGIKKTFMLHRLVAENFLENPYDLPEVNHKDEDKANNCVWNLEFCTRKYNNNYGTKIQRSVKSHDYKKSAIKSALHHDYAKVGRKQSKKVLQIDCDGNIVKAWDSLKSINSIYKNSGGNISMVCNGKKKKAYGYFWKYTEAM